MYKDRRKHKRYEIKLKVSSQLIHQNEKGSLTEGIPVETRDLSLGGVRLRWPKKWDCPKCTKCLGWVFNFGCPLKEDIPERVDRYLDQSIKISLKVDIKGQEPKEILAKVVWTNTQNKRKSKYDVGLNFIDVDKEKQDILQKLIQRKVGNEN
jgi:c-di-GMP-binding flagellar brake protein YcgR